MTEMTKHRIARMAFAVRPQRGPMAKWGTTSGSMLGSPVAERMIDFNQEKSTKFKLGGSTKNLLVSKNL
jgi:hypothetical protein